MRGTSAEHGTETRYRWELKHGGSCEACRKAHAERDRKAKFDESEWRGGWVRRGPILVPAGPRPVDPPAPEARSQPKPIKHGTDTGYGLHKRRKEEACEPCKAAHRQAWHDCRNRGKQVVMTRQERLAKGVAA